MKIAILGLAQSGKKTLFTLLTGRPVPEAARGMVDLVRAWIEDKAGDSLRNLADVIDDQNAFARLVRNLITELDMGDDLGESPEDTGDDDHQEDGQDASEGEDGERGQSGESDGMNAERVEMSDGEDEEGQEQAVQIEMDEQHAAQEADEIGDGTQPQRPDARADSAAADALPSENTSPIVAP